MKKALSLILALVLCIVLCLNLSACKDNTIQLTLDNYSSYLTVSAGIHAGNDTYITKQYIRIPDSNLMTDHFYEDYFASLNVEALTTNFNFNDVHITVRISASPTVWKELYPNALEIYAPQSLRLPDCTLDVKLDIAGNGSISTGFTKLPDGLAMRDTNSTFEIISISGTITPA